MSSERRGAERLLLDSIRTFRSMLLKVMVAVRRRWLQRSPGEEPESANGRREDGVEVWTTGDRISLNEFGIESTVVTAAAGENEMNTVELQRILGYLNIGLAIAHDSGVSIGHFGSGDFLQLAQTVNGILLHSIEPKCAPVPPQAPAVTAGTPCVVAAIAN